MSKPASGLIDKLLKLLLGDDIFISYARSDGATYAAGLADELARRGFSCRLDQWGTESGGEMPESLKKALRRSASLVLVGTKGAAQSRHVGEEVRELKRRKRMVIPVLFDGVLLKNGFTPANGILARSEAQPADGGAEAVWAAEIEGLPVSCERQEALSTGEPSDAVPNRIEKTCTFWKKDKRLRITSSVVVMLLVALIGASMWAGSVATTRAAEARQATAAAVAAQARAREQQALAEQKTQEAVEATQRAKQADEAAKAAEKLAEEKTELADQATKKADEQTRLAAEKARLAAAATGRAEIASAEAAKQQNIALARRLAAENNLAADPQSPEIEKKILLTVESMLRYPSLEAYGNLIDGIRTMPTLQTSVTHPEKVSELAFSPDGEYLATVAGGVLWLRQTGGLASRGAPGEARRLSREGESWTHAVAFSPDGKYLAAVDGGDVRLWLADGTREFNALHGRSYLFSGDSRHIAVVDEGKRPGGEDRSFAVVVFQLDEGATREVARVALMGTLSNISFSSDAKLFTTFAAKEEYGEKLLNFWRTDGGTQTAPARDTWRLGGAAQSAGFSPNPKYIWSLSETADLPEQTLRRADTREVVLDKLLTQRFSPDGRFLVTGSADSEYASISGAEVWDASGERLEKLYSFREPFGGFVFSRDGKYLANSSGGASVKVWNTLSGQLVAYVKTGPDSGVPAFTPDGRFLAVSVGQEVKLWPLSRDWKSSETEHTPRGVAALSPDGRFMAAVSDEVVSILRAEDGGKVWSGKAPCSVTGVAFDWEGGRLATGGPCGVRLWDARDGRMIGGIGDRDVNFVAFSRDGRYLAVAGKGVEAHEGVEVREIANPSKAVLIEPAEGGLSHPLAVAFSADGVQLAVAYTNEIIVWEWRVRRPVRRVYEVLSNDDFNTFRIAFDTEGKLVAADMYAAHIWDISEKPRPVGSVELQAMHTRTDYTTTLSPNGRFVATTYGFASAKNRLGAKTAVWELQPTHIMASACQRLSVCLSGTEWRREFDTEPQRKTCKALGVSVPGDCQE